MFYLETPSNSNRTINSGLAQIYPNIKGELANRCSLQIDQVLGQFETIYNQQAEYVAIVNGNVDIVATPGFKLSMGIQKNIVVCFKRTEMQDNLFFNFNGNEDEVMINKKGQTQDKSSIMSQWLSKIYKAAVDDLSLSKINGGILYIHSHLNKGDFDDTRCICLAVYLAILHLNDLYGQYSDEEMIKKLNQFDLISGYIEQLFNHRYYSVTLTHNNNFDYILFPDSHKMLFYKIDEKLACPLFIDQDIKIEEDSLFEEIKAPMSLETLFEKLWKLQFVQFQQSTRQYLQKFELDFPKSQIVISKDQKYLIFLCHQKFSSEWIQKLTKIKLQEKKVAGFVESGMQQKWGNKYNTRDQIFASVPCLNFGIYNPNNDSELQCMI